MRILYGMNFKLFGFSLGWRCRWCIGSWQYKCIALLFLDIWYATVHGHFAWSKVKAIDRVWYARSGETRRGVSRTLIFPRKVRTNVPSCLYLHYLKLHILWIPKHAAKSNNKSQLSSAIWIKRDLSVGTFARILKDFLFATVHGHDPLKTTERVLLFEKRYSGQLRTSSFWFRYASGTVIWYTRDIWRLHRERAWSDLLFILLNRLLRRYWNYTVSLITIPISPLLLYSPLSPLLTSEYLRNRQGRRILSSGR